MKREKNRQITVKNPDNDLTKDYFNTIIKLEKTRVENDELFNPSEEKWSVIKKVVLYYSSFEKVIDVNEPPYNGEVEEVWTKEQEKYLTNMKGSITTYVDNKVNQAKIEIIEYVDDKVNQAKVEIIEYVDKRFDELKDLIISLHNK